METKSFWQRPEGKTGILFLIAGIIGAGYLAMIALPFILTMLQTAFMTGVLAVAIAVPTILLMDNNFRLKLKALYQITMRKFTGWVVELDPIAIVEGYLRTLEKSLETMSNQLDLLHGQETKLNTKINNNKSEVEKHLTKAHYAKDKCATLDPNSAQGRDYLSLASLEANKAARLKESNEKLMVVLNKISGLRGVLEKMYSSAKFVLADMTDEVKIKKEEREAILTGSSAFESAMKVLDGNKDEKALFDESMEFMATDMGNKIGRIERFMENSGNILTNMDVEKEMFDNKGLLLIDEWEKNSDMFITSSKDISKNQIPTYIAPSNNIPITKANKYL